MKTLIWLVVFEFCLVDGYCQQFDQFDSLKAALTISSKTDIDRININSRIAWLFLNSSKYDSAILYYQRARSIPLLRDEVEWRGNVHLGLGVAYLRKDNWDSSSLHLNKSLSVFESIKDTNNLAIAYGNVSILYKNKGLYEEALSSAFKSLSFFEKRAPVFGLASCYNNIATIYKRTGNYHDAGIYYRKALSICLLVKEPFEVSKAYNNLGEMFVLMKQYDSARYNLILSVNLKRSLNENQSLYRTLSRLAKIVMLEGNPSLAESQLLESLRTQRQIDDAVGMIETLNNLGELYLNANRLAESNKNLLEANTIIRTAGTPDYLRQNLELRIALARKQKDFATGMILQDELLIIRDSLLNEEKSKSLQAMQIRYETQKKEQEIALLEQREEISQAKIESNRILIGALVTGLILVVAIGFLIYANLKNSKAAKQHIELLLSETRHRMKNHLQTLASIFHLQTRHYTNHEMVLEAKSSESRVHTMSLLHDMFFTNEIDEVINARDYLSDLVHKLVEVYGSQTRNLKLSLEIEDVELDIDKAFALSLIIQELVCNTFKYAFDHEPNPELLVDIHERSDYVHATIHDNGIGFSGNKFGTSQGLNLVDALVSQLDGEMHVDNNRGTTFMISFPATSLWKKPAFS